MSQEQFKNRSNGSNLNKGKVVLLDVNENKGKKILKEFGKVRVVFLKCDITKAKQIDSCLFKATRLFGTIESAVNTTYPLSAKNKVKFEIQKEIIKDGSKGSWNRRCFKRCSFRAFDRFGRVIFD